eukprot:6462824-Amphidinium_carterae.1
MDKGPLTITGKGEGGQTVRVSGRATNVHKPLLSAARTLKGKIAILDEHGGLLLPLGSGPGKQLQKLAEKVAGEREAIEK